MSKVSNQTTYKREQYKVYKRNLKFIQMLYKQEPTQERLEMFRNSYKAIKEI